MDPHVRLLALAGLGTVFVACSAPLEPGVDAGADPAVSITYTTTWTLPIAADLDVVYVLDTGPAMADLQDKVAAQVATMTSALRTCGAEGVPPNIRTLTVSSSTGELLSTLASGVAGFPRPDAALVVIIITNGDDASPGAVSAFVQNLQSSKTDPYQVVVVGVLGPASPRLTEFVDDFPNGIIGSISDDSWAAPLSSLCRDGEGDSGPQCVPATAEGCVVTEHVTTADDAQDLIVPPCAGDSSDGFCSSLAPNAGCVDAGDAVIVANQPTGSDSPNHRVELLELSISSQLRPPDPLS